ncbi:MAG: sucrase ferredoxin, partial [Nakamurella sp.]
MPLPEPALPGPIHVEPELATRMLCSDADLAARDDPRGSAAEFTRFLLIERLSGFGREAGDDALRAVYGQASSEITAVPGLRPFAIRPVGRTDGPDSQVRWIGRVGVDAVLQPTATRPTSQDLFALDTARASAISPLFAVCTNGSRDRCCAVKGRDLAARLHHALDDPDEAPSVVEISHLGGHRFAPTMLVLPWAYAYARLDAEAALNVAYAAQDGLVHPTGLRGRADLGPAAQAAEVFW